MRPITAVLAALTLACAGSGPRSSPALGALPTQAQRGPLRPPDGATLAAWASTCGFSPENRFQATWLDLDRDGVDEGLICWGQGERGHGDSGCSLISLPDGTCQSVLGGLDAHLEHLVETPQGRYAWVSLADYGTELDVQIVRYDGSAHAVERFGTPRPPDRNCAELGE